MPYRKQTMLYYYDFNNAEYGRTNIWLVKQLRTAYIAHIRRKVFNVTTFLDRILPYVT
jgi:hypothetical protein